MSGHNFINSEIQIVAYQTPSCFPWKLMVEGTTTHSVKDSQKFVWNLIRTPTELFQKLLLNFWKFPSGFPQKVSWNVFSKLIPQSYSIKHSLSSPYKLPISRGTFQMFLSGQPIKFFENFYKVFSDHFSRVPWNFPKHSSEPWSTGTAPETRS